jgi:hypothetical protein
MKGDVKGHFFPYDRRRRVGFDVQPLTTAVGSERYVARMRFNHLQVQRGPIF